VDAPTAATLLHALAAAGLLPRDAVVNERKGKAEWVVGDLLHRINLRQGGDGTTLVTYRIGDSVLGRPFPEGGILALVTVRPAAPWQVRWPATEAEVGPWLAQMGALVASSSGAVAHQRDLVALLLAPEPVVRGPLVVDPGDRYAEAVVRAFAIADASADLDLLVAVLEVLRNPAAHGGSLLAQAQYWADQWSYQSGREIVLPTTVAEVDAVIAQAAAVRSISRTSRTDVPPGAGEFWDHVG
jgi:hypothetical protein